MKARATLILAAVAACLALAAPTAQATIAPSHAEQIVRKYLGENERRVGIPQPIIKCWVLSQRRTRCNVHTRSEGWWQRENLKVDVYGPGRIDWNRQFGH